MNKIINWDKFEIDNIPEMIEDKFEEEFILAVRDYVRFPKFETRENINYRNNLKRKLIEKTKDLVLCKKTLSIPYEWRYHGDYITVNEVIIDIESRLKTYDISLTRAEIDEIKKMIT